MLHHVCVVRGEGRGSLADRCCLPSSAAHLTMFFCLVLVFESLQYVPVAKNVRTVCEIPECARNLRYFFLFQLSFKVLCFSNITKLIHFAGW